MTYRDQLREWLGQLDQIRVRLTAGEFSARSSRALERLDLLDAELAAELDLLDADELPVQGAA